MSKYPIWLPVATLVAGVALAVALFPRDEALPPTYLPGDTITVEVIPKAALDKIAAASGINGVLTLEMGQLRDENDRLLEVVERLSVVTPASTATEPAIQVLKDACEQGDIPDLTYRARLDSFKFRGLDKDGDLNWGWRGSSLCEVRSEATEWTLLASWPFELSQVEAQTSVAPTPRREPARWYAGLHYPVLKTGTSSFRAYAGHNFFPKSRHPVGIGVFGDSHQAGIDLRYSW